MPFIKEEFQLKKLGFNGIEQIRFYTSVVSILKDFNIPFLVSNSNAHTNFIKCLFALVNSIE